MASVKAWTALIAVTSIAGAVFTAFLPAGKMKKAFSTLVGIVFICAAMSPIASKEKINFDFSDDLLNFEKSEVDFAEKSDSAARTVAESGFKKAVENALESIGCSAEKIIVKCDDKPNVKTVNIVLNGDFNEQKIKSKIKSICPDAEITVSKR